MLTSKKQLDILSRNRHGLIWSFQRDGSPWLCVIKSPGLGHLATCSGCVPKLLDVTAWVFIRGRLRNAATRTQMFPFSFGTLLRKASPSRSCQEASAVCFPLQREDTLNKSDGSVYFLHVEGRETQDWFYPLPGNSKVSGRPLCQGKGKIEIWCGQMRTDRE